ncbi:unnamed protein product, partial [Staurois parvus]
MYHYNVLCVCHVFTFLNLPSVLPSCVAALAGKGTRKTDTGIGRRTPVGGHSG